MNKANKREEKEGGTEADKARLQKVRGTSLEPAAAALSKYASAASGSAAKEGKKKKEAKMSVAD